MSKNRYQIEGRAETFTLAQLLDADAESAPTVEEEAAIESLLNVGDVTSIDAGNGEEWLVRRVC